MPLEKQRKGWVLFYTILVIAAFVVPFLPPLRYIGKLHGAFLFWIIFALLVIGCMALMTRNWRD